MLPIPPRSTATDPAPVVARDLIDRVRAERTARDAADVRILVLAVEWADRHTIDPATGFPCTKSFLEREPGDGVDYGADPEALEWLGLPELRWDTAASFAAALGMSTTSGKAYLRDALTLSCRMPLVWARVLAGEVAVWRARKIAQTVLGQHDDVVAYLDKDIAPRAGTIGPVLLERALKEAMLRLHAEEREIDQLENLDRRYATLLEDTINHTGIAEFIIRGDWCDVTAFDDKVAEVAAALASAGCEESLDVRRSMAAGVLADPERALALLAAQPAETQADTDESKPASTSVLVPTPKRRVVLNLDLTPGHLAGLDPVICDVEGRPVLEQLIRTWCSRPDLTVTVRPIRHCAGCLDCTTAAGDPHLAGPYGTDYTPTGRTREVVTRRDRHCVFPHCTRPAASCDLDHIRPFDHTDPTRGGPTNAENLAPLCRHHHRLKTHAAWTYTMLEPGTYLWADKYGQHFLTTRHGTTDLDRTSIRR